MVEAASADGRASRSGSKTGARAAKPRPGRATRRADPETADPKRPVAAVALDLIGKARSRAILYVAADERQAEKLGQILARLAPALETLVFPAWDCLPFDRVSPSPDTTGRRIAVLQALIDRPEARRIVVGTVDAVLQKVPPRAAVAEARFSVARGAPFSEDTLRAFADRTGYRLSHDRVEEPGDIQFQGKVAEIFVPAAPLPFRLDVEDGTVTDISSFDPVGQRRIEQIGSVTLGPASELVRAPDAEALERTGGIEHRLAAFYEEPLETIFDALPDVSLIVAPETEARSLAFFEQLAEAQEARAMLPSADAGTPALPPRESLYLEPEAWREILARRAKRDLVGQGFSPVPDFAQEAKPVQAFQRYLDQALAEGTRVVLAGVPRDLAAFGRFLTKHGGGAPAPAADWAAVRKGKSGSFHSLDLDLDEGVVDTRHGIALVAAADVLGTRAHRSTGGPSGPGALLPEPPMLIGDTVIHEDHGIGILRGLEAIAVDGATQEAVRIEYHGEASLLVPTAELDKVWRYGGDDEAVTLDRLHTEAWAKRRVAVESAVKDIAGQLVAMAEERAQAVAPKLVPSRRDYERFAARFPFAETRDQSDAIAAVLADLAGGRPMDRLVCGDVGFGKTEVALRAAAAAALAGKQVAVVAPTTVLARQHLQTFGRRFVRFGIEVAGLSRLAGPAEARRVKAGLADGSIRIVIGTQAVVGADFADLGLLIIDEEQRFGAKLKSDLRALAAKGHVLTLTATPIPRTLQMAMVGIQAVSVIATPPVRRRPVRTFTTPFDPASVRIALLREKSRGGQSFVVVPRIADIASMRERLAKLVPELGVGVAHGDLPAEAVDEAMMEFAEGRGDVLLATNIIESGLDVPRANTMLICRADLFGLAQLHQLRGRVGRGRQQGVAYLMTDPEAEIGAATEARLTTLASLDRLGSGLAISARDLDLRGAGDLVGDEQAGHMQLIGLGLYQILLGRAVRLAKGEPVRNDAPFDLQLEVAGLIPADYVAEPDARIELYARLARLDELKAIQAFAEEIEDRFGEPPTDVAILFALARLRALGRTLDLAGVSAGPRAIAVTFRPGRLDGIEQWIAGQPDLALKDDRLVWTWATEADAGRLDSTEDLLQRLVEGLVRTPAAG